MTPGDVGKLMQGGFQPPSPWMIDVREWRIETRPTSRDDTAARRMSICVERAYPSQKLK
jgi:hypothetical protein